MKTKKSYSNPQVEVKQLLSAMSVCYISFDTTTGSETGGNSWIDAF